VPSITYLLPSPNVPLTSSNKLCCHEHGKIYIMWKCKLQMQINLHLKYFHLSSLSLFTLPSLQQTFILDALLLFKRRAQFLFTCMIHLTSNYFRCNISHKTSLFTVCINTYITYTDYFEMFLSTIHSFPRVKNSIGSCINFLHVYSRTPRTKQSK
jgi:hypothetical protein